MVLCETVSVFFLVVSLAIGCQGCGSSHGRSDSTREGSEETDEDRAVDAEDGPDAMDGGQVFDADAVEDGSGDATPDGAVDAEACTTFADPVVVGRVESAELTELSGLAMSRRHSDVLYGHNDSGDEARFFAFRRSGESLAVFRLEGIEAEDWEDMTMGPGPGPGEWLYFGDIGDNRRGRAEIILLRLPEPSDPTANQVIDDFQRLRLRYPDGAHDAETLMIDPESGDIYLLTKTFGGDSGLYVARAPLSDSAVNELELVASLRFGRGALTGFPMTTGGDVAPDGRAILIRTYDHVFYWTREEGQTIESAISATPRRVISHTEPQGESISFTADGRGFFTVSEGEHPQIYSFAPHENCEN